jgi:transposase
MSLQDPRFGDYPIPEETRRVAETAFPKGNIFMQLRDRFGMLYDNQQFAHLFAHDGAPALSPARLALITIMQFMECLADRQAADAVRDRISWKYALGLDLDDPGFDYSVLSEFRARLLTDHPERLLFDHVLDLFREAGLLKARGKQRTDSTHILAAIRTLHRLENVGETLRHALNQLAVIVPGWTRTHADPQWVERYAHRIEQYRLPKEDAQRQALAHTIGQDGYQLLALLAHPETPLEARQLPAVATLRQVWVQQYYRCTIPGHETMRWRTAEEQPPSGQLISSPYDPEARYKTKRETHWIGYKLHLTETCDDDSPNVITHVATTPATTADYDLTEPIQQALLEKNLAPAEHYVDMGYTDAGVLVESHQQRAIQLIGPVAPDPAWQARVEGGISLALFRIDWEGESAECPAGKRSQYWIPVTDRTGNAGIHISWRREDCTVCPLRQRCTKAQAGARVVTIRPREQHLALQEMRAYQTTDAFKAQYRRRAGVEGTFSQANRRSDVRHARYIGLAKTHLQHLITAIALNLFRVLAWFDEIPRAQTRTSAFANLMRGSS